MLAPSHTLLRVRSVHMLNPNAALPSKRVTLANDSLVFLGGGGGGGGGGKAAPKNKPLTMQEEMAARMKSSSSLGFCVIFVIFYA